jgi:DNA-binding CsgD family transcriptional regulator
VSFDAIRAIEACYRASSDDERWLRGIAEALRPIAPWYGSYGMTFPSYPGARFRLLSVAVDGHMPGNWRGAFAAAEKLPADSIASTFQPGFHLASRRLRWLWTTPPLEALEELREAIAASGTNECVGLTGSQAGGRRAHIGYLVPASLVPGPRLRHQLGQVTRHLDAAFRLRVACGGAEVSPDDASTEAVFGPAGCLLHATQGGLAPRACDTLSAAVRRMERARGSLRHIDPEQALALWSALLDGQWTLVEHVDSDGRRFILARRNPPGVRDPKALGAKERRVAELAAKGLSNKSIGYELGMVPGTVSGHLRKVQMKLGVRSRRELIELLAAWSRRDES